MTSHHYPPPPQPNRNPPLIDLDMIRIDEGIQSRVALDSAIVKEYREAFLAGANFPAVTLFFDGIDRWLADGFHRVAGARAAGHTTICGTITTGSRRDAVLHSVGANSNHGLRRSNADKRKAVETMLADVEWRLWSDNKIAQACGVSDKTVAAVRAISGNSEDAQAVRTVMRGGKSYRQDTSKIGKAADAPAPTTAPNDALGNAAFRALFSLPPIRESFSTGLMIPAMPPQKAVTGDDEVDAMLWLQAVVDTGNQALIDKALEAAKRIKTPMNTLADRYAAHILGSGGHTMQAVFATMGFGELEARAKGAIAKEARRHEALSRFGAADALFADVPAEAACKEALDGMEALQAKHYRFDEEQATERFSARPALAPATLEDCLYAMNFWDALYRLRSAAGDIGDPDSAGQAHDDYAFASLARIPPRTTVEAIVVLDYLTDKDAMDRAETNDILRNLIRGPRA
jgi:hypothetical protein